MPLSLVFTFFGMNAKEVDRGRSMLDLSGDYTTFYLVLLTLVVIKSAL